MDSTTNLLLPFIMPAQAQKFLAHNTALQVLDALVMLSVKDRTLSAPPSTPAEGDRHIVGPSPNGAWAGKAGVVASWQAGTWAFFTPQDGWLAWCVAEAGLLVYSGGAWGATGAGSLQNVPLLGVNAIADDTNRLSVSADATLFAHAGSSHRVMVNKHAAADTASLIFEDNFSSRAEIGLCGDDKLHFRVTPDGTSFYEAIVIDGTTGKPSFPAASFLESFALNLYGDSGRMAGNGASGTGVASFAFPGYLTLYNGATAASQGKFIFDNATYGGVGASLDPLVKGLIDMIRDPSVRRFNIEFFVARVTAGTVTDAAAKLVVGADTGYCSLFTAQKVRPPAATFHVYLRALDDNLLVGISAGSQAVTKNGVLQTGSFAISPGDGWVSITVKDIQAPYSSYGYTPGLLNLYAKAVGNRYLVACPALMSGITDVDDNIGVVAAYNSWQA